MNKTIFVGHFVTGCLGFDERQARKDFKTMKSKFMKYASESLMDGNVFCFSCASQNAGELLVDKMLHMSDKGSIRCSFQYALVEEVESDLKSFMIEYMAAEEDRAINRIISSHDWGWEDFRQPTEDEYEEQFSVLGLDKKFYGLFKEIFNAEYETYWNDEDSESYFLED